MKGALGSSSRAEYALMQEQAGLGEVFLSVTAEGQRPRALLHLWSPPFGSFRLAEFGPPI